MIKKYADLIEMLEKIFGKGAVSRTIGTRTNVVRFPKGKQPIDPTVGNFDVEGTAIKSPDLVQTIENSIEDRMGDITKMNDQELLTYTANVRRLLNFKEPPIQNADVVKFGSGEEIKGEGLEKLIQKQGTKNPPTTAAGQLETTGKRLEQLGEDFAKEFDVENIAKQEAERQAMIARQYEGKGYAGGVFGPSGMYRAVARDFLLDQHAKGKIKLDADTLRNLEERNYISGGQPLMYADPIRVLRYHYGDDVFEKIPLDKISTGARSEIIDVMSKVEAPPVKTEAPKTPGGYLTPGEYRANIEEMQKIEDMIKRRESRFADMTEEEIQNELAQYGGKRSSFEMGLEYDYPKEYEQYLKLNNPKEYYKAQEMKKITPLNEPSKPYKPFGSDFTRQEKVDWLIKNVDQEAKVTIPSPEFLQNMLDSGREDLIDHFWEIHTKNIGSKPVIDIDTSNLKNPALVKAMMEDRAKKPKLVFSKEKVVEDSVDDAGKINKDDLEPEGKADGGRIGYSGGSKEGILDVVKKDYDKSITKKIIDKGDEINETVADALRRQIESRLTDEQRKKMNRFLGIRDATISDIIKDSSSEGSTKAIKRTEEADGGRIGFNKGKRVKSSIDKLLENLNKKTQGKKSMESVDPKTGEVTVPKKSIRRAEEPTGMTTMDVEPEIVDERSIKKTKSIMTIDDLKTKHKDAFEAHDQIFNVDINDKIAPDMIAESMAETRGKDYFSLSQEEQSNLYKKALAYVDDVRMTKRQNKISISDEMSQAKQEGIQKTNKMIELGLDPSSSKDYDKFLEMESIKQKYGNVIDDNLLQQILIDDNPQRKAEVLASIDEAIKMQEKGIPYEEIINIMKNTTRTKQADGGIAGLL
jgi:hypothetical protein